MNEQKVFLSPSGCRFYYDANGVTRDASDAEIASEFMRLEDRARAAEAQKERCAGLTAVEWRGLFIKTQDQWEAAKATSERLRAALADAESNYRRWHQAFMALKYGPHAPGDAEALAAAETTDYTKRGEVMNPPASAAEGAEAGNLNTPHVHGTGAVPQGDRAQATRSPAAPSVKELVEQARKWPRESVGEGYWFNEMADALEYLEGVVDEVYHTSMAAEIGDEGCLREIREICCDAAEKCEAGAAEETGAEHG